MRFAYFSPLSPQRSGISDYSQELLPYLARDAEITLFVDGFHPTDEQLIHRFPWHDYQKDAHALNSLDDYDAVIYHMGNDHRYHSGIFDTIERHPGIIVFHDFALEDFFLGLARQRNDLRIYLNEIAGCHGNLERKRAAEYLERGSVPPHVAAPLNFPLNSRLARAAEGIIAHSEWSRSRLEHIAPGVPTRRINMPVKPSNSSARVHEQGGRVQGPGDRVSIASFGLLIPGKGIERVISALSLLREYDFHYTLVGSENNYFDVRAIIQKYNMHDRVSITGHVSLSEFERHIGETDIALNIRERHVGETSASLCRSMAAGVASVVADVGWYAELPNDAVVKIPLEDHFDALLVAYLRRLIEDSRLRQSIGENARRYALAEHAIERTAADYLSFIGEVIRRRPQRKLVAGVSRELSVLGVRASDEQFMRSIATDVAVLSNLTSEIAKVEFTRNDAAAAHGDTKCAQALALSDNGSGQTVDSSRPADGDPRPSPKSGRLPKIDGIDYKQAAIEYLGKLSEERQHHLRTKPFYNLAHKPAKYKNEGMDEDMHRHFCDFANMAVALALPPGSRILDVGCGSGWLSEYFARLGYEVKGIDISPSLIEMSRERVDHISYGVDHETPLRCTFEVHDIELAPLAEKFDAIVCYDSLHHFEDERSVVRNLAQMVSIGGRLFILEGGRPETGSASERELHEVMREFRTLESPFDSDYLRALLNENGFAIVGDYVSVNGLFERDMLEGGQLPLKTVDTDYYYLNCVKVSEGQRASSVRDSRAPGVLSARFSLRDVLPERVAAGDNLSVPLNIENSGDTLWLTGRTTRAGTVMPAVRVFDESGTLVNEFHGEPPLPHAVAPGQTVGITIQYVAPSSPGKYTVKIDLVDQQVCWFEHRGSLPFVFSFVVT